MRKVRVDGQQEQNCNSDGDRRMDGAFPWRWNSGNMTGWVNRMDGEKGKRKFRLDSGREQDNRRDEDRRMGGW